MSADMQSLAEEIGCLIRENWSLAEIAQAGEPTLRVQVGDYFANIGAGTVIVNRSSLANALNRVDSDTNKEIRWALDSVAESTERRGGPSSD